MRRNSRRKYTNGERIFSVDFNTKNNDGYLKVVDVDTKVEFYLPYFIIEDMTYVFSWDRYEEEIDKEKALESLNKILETMKQNKDLPKGIEDIKRFISEISSL